MSIFVNKGIPLLKAWQGQFLVKVWAFSLTRKVVVKGWRRKFLVKHQIKIGSSRNLLVRTCRTCRILLGPCWILTWNLLVNECHNKETWKSWAREARQYGESCEQRDRAAENDPEATKSHQRPPEAPRGPQRPPEAPREASKDAQRPPRASQIILWGYS